jgi:hypothetical protein
MMNTRKHGAFMKALTLLLTIACLMAATAQAADNAASIPSGTSSSMGLKGAPNPFSLLSSSRIKWSNSYSVSFFSGGGTSGSVGLLRTSMGYELSSKLSMTFNLGIMHNQGSLWGDSRNAASVLPGFRLDYHPSETFRMILDIQRVNGAMYPYGSGAGFWRDPMYPY